MAATLIGGPVTQALEKSDDAHRDYSVTYLVKVLVTEGVYTALNCPDLPAPGSPWVFQDEVDVWAFRRQGASVVIHNEREGDPSKYYAVTLTFSTRPTWICSESEIEDPLREPQAVSGSFLRRTKEATYDRFYKPIKSSSHEMLRGPQVEFDKSKPTVIIEQNVADLQLALFSSMIDTVNSTPMWGLPPRCVKLDTCPWQKKYYGVCSVYFTRRLEFSVDFETFDRTLMDEGTKVLIGAWVRANADGTKPSDYGKWKSPESANYLDPTNFQRFKDLNDENCRVILDGGGQPAMTLNSFDPNSVTPPTPGEAGKIKVEKYFQSNFFLLGIPPVLEAP